jgi:hypothetical protein
MKKLYVPERIFVISLFLLLLNPILPGHSKPLNSNIISAKEKTNFLFNKLHLLQYGLKPAALEQALDGYKKLDNLHLIRNADLISIVDFSQSSTAKRLYILDISKNELLFQTWVAHGKNSGVDYATSFSNVKNSLKSSRGFYITGEAYSGSHGISLKLKGMENGINNFAESRAIVIHGASYVSEDFIRNNGRLGRSFGCPAISDKISRNVIDLIKNGSCFFIYAESTLAFPKRS